MAILKQCEKANDNDETNEQTVAAGYGDAAEHATGEDCPSVCVSAAKC